MNCHVKRVHESSTILLFDFDLHNASLLCTMLLHLLVHSALANWDKMSREDWEIRGTALDLLSC